MHEMNEVLGLGSGLGLTLAPAKPNQSKNFIIA